MGEMKNNTSLGMNPYYKMEYGDWRFRVGAHLDWWSGAENQMNVSPDLNVELNFLDSYVLYAQAGGGRENKSLMELTDVTPYWALAQPYLLPTYVTLDAQLGLKASPANGWWFNLTGGYQMREDDLFFGVADEKGMTAAFAQADSKVAYGAAELKYDYKDLFDCTLKATYYHWDLSKPKEQDGQVKQITLALKPELEVNAEVGMKPMSGLRVNVGYEYVKRCEGLYDPISNLYLGADYALLKNLSVYGQIRNLMNKEYVRADAYPAQKMNALVGLSLRF
jgi:outer membrane receptor protein involved in Fe transport